tara:strand:+ start:42 stop:245 length:204 start_codon:yes stop_codon:yes gene_type:complete
MQLHDGQCGMCEHFGAGQDEQKLVQIRVNGDGPADLLEPCGHPDHAPLKLQVTPISGCAGFKAAKSA